MSKINASKFNELRELAEQKLGEQGEDLQEPASEEIQHLIHELQVYQVELETQNEDLCIKQQQIEELYDKYFNLFELSPVGFFTFSDNGIIQEVNLTGADLLGVERKYLIKRGFSLYVATDYHDAFFSHCKRTFETKKRQTCELQLAKKDGAQLYLQLTSAVTKDNPPQILTYVTDITERKQVEEKIYAYQNQLQHLAYELSLAEERERHRIAMELHDSTTQNLIISNVKLGELLKAASSTGLDEKIEEIRVLIDEAIEQTRSLKFRLGIPILKELGLGVAVECLIEELQEKHNIQFHFEEEEQDEPIGEEICLILFRMLRELLINIVKHAHAHKAKVSLLCAEDGHLCITVEDDGVGFDTSKINERLDNRDGFGLFSIREQVKILGGHLEIESEPGHGTRVTIVSPRKINKK